MAHWNSWAEKMRTKRKAIETDGHWAAEKNKRGELEPKNEETRAWTEAARVDFFRCHFLVRAAGDATVIREEEKNEGEDARSPIKVIQLEGNSAIFSGFVFPGDTSFDEANFSRHTRFRGATFCGAATFDNATFSDYAWFEETTFSGNAWFVSATFTGEAWFFNATFTADALFGNATFSSAARFFRATFIGDARFGSATFQKSTNYREAKFSKEASFTGIKVDRSFDMTEADFKRVPAFNQADFKQAPELDSVKFPLPLLARKGEANLVARYRAIRRLAIQGADYEREQMAFKGEIRSKRGAEHRWYHAAFWYGLAYDALSDFGRSMSRPSLIWLVSIMVFSLFYLASSHKLESAFAHCGTADASNFESALIISWKNALPLIGDAKAEEVARSCLYGAAAYGGIAIQGFQRIWSALVIFLFLLAVRNQFKIK